MGGMLILVLLGLYVWLVYRLTLRFTSIWRKTITILVAVSIPTVDAVYGRVKLKQMCDAEGGLKIVSTADGVEGFQYPGRPETEWLTKYGFKYIESIGGGTTRGGNFVDRARIEPNGSVMTERNVTPISQYAFEREAISLGNGFGYGEYRVTNIKTKERLGVYRNYAFEGGWVERSIAGLYASKALASGCDFGDSWAMTLKLIQSTLKPTKS